MKILIGVGLGILIMSFSIVVYFATGVAPVATSSPQMPFEKRLAKLALHARLRREMPTNVPYAADEPNLEAGAEVYRQNCAVCHGLPNQPESAVAHGMFPPPPKLFVDTVADDTVGETYWKTKNGIRLTGMPGFQNSLPDIKLWQVSLLLKHADKIPSTVQSVLQAVR
jgi:thiosulfate dehydrogenase